MKDEVTLHPAKGLMVRDPELKDFLPEEGRKVRFSDYWLRRLRDGDVFEAAPPPPKDEMADLDSNPESR